MDTILQTVTFMDLLTLSTFMMFSKEKKPLSLGVFIMYLQHTNIKLSFAYNFTTWIKVTTSPQGMLNLTFIGRWTLLSKGCYFTLLPPGFKSPDSVKNSRLGAGSPLGFNYVHAFTSKPTDVVNICSIHSCYFLINTDSDGKLKHTSYHSWSYDSKW